jgi:predicted RNA-binding protein YlxR (DUF448 family)/ribosomal protein L7Ae-like RNA K-turn-binding protein
VPDGAERTCVVCRTALPRERGLRIVLGPDGEPALDFRGRLPGRGAWVCWTGDCLRGVTARGVLDRAFKQRVAIPVADPPWPLAEVLAFRQKRQRELIALGAKSGDVRSGGNVVRALLQKGWPRFLLLANDAGTTVRADWERRAAGHGVPVHALLLTSEEVGAAVGRDGPRSVLGCGAGPLARSLADELQRTR